MHERARAQSNVGERAERAFFAGRALSRDATSLPRWNSCNLMHGGFGFVVLHFLSKGKRFLKKKPYMIFSVCFPIQFFFHKKTGVFFLTEIKK